MSIKWFDTKSKVHFGTMWLNYLKPEPWPKNEKKYGAAFNLWLIFQLIDGSVDRRGVDGPDAGRVASGSCRARHSGPRNKDK